MLSFEKIRDMERAERESRGLQKMPDNFIEEIREYIGRKEKGSSREVANIRNVIRSLFELREKKIIESVLYHVKTSMPVENLSSGEEKTFIRLVEEIRKFRQDVFGELKKHATVEDAAKEENSSGRAKEVVKQPAIPVSYVYRFKKTVEKFMGPDMKEYTFKENDTIPTGMLPKPLNDLLLKQGIIEQVEKK